MTLCDNIFYPIIWKTSSIERLANISLFFMVKKCKTSKYFGCIRIAAVVYSKPSRDFSSNKSYFII